MSDSATIAAFIRTAIACGEAHGTDALTPVQKTVFLIAEAEIHADMGGDLLCRYRREQFVQFADAFAAIGATDIAARFLACAADRKNPAQDSALYNIISARLNYSHEHIAAYVATQLYTEDNTKKPE